MNDNSKKQRQQLIKRIISERAVSDQEELLAELQKNGITATQATVSRDLQEIGVTKVRVATGQFQYSVLESLPKNYLLEQLRVLFENFVCSVAGTGNLVLVKTSPGNANGVASLVDRVAFPGIMGTVAGDDTIIVVVDTESNRRKVQGQLNELLAAVNRG